MAGTNRGTSLAKGPVAVVGVALLAYGVTALIFGGHGFGMHPLGGTVTGKTWLALEVNGWSSLLFVTAGVLLLFGSPLHWGAKTASLITGLALAAASVIALIPRTRERRLATGERFTREPDAREGAVAGSRRNRH